MAHNHLYLPHSQLWKVSQDILLAHDTGQKLQHIRNCFKSKLFCRGKNFITCSFFTCQITLFRHIRIINS
jgi:hypothetical protein